MRYNPPLSTLMSTGSPMATAPILGLSHLTFIVRDVDRTARLFCEGRGAQEVYDSQGRTSPYPAKSLCCWVGCGWRSWRASHRHSVATATLPLPWLTRICPPARRAYWRWGQR